MASRPVDRSEFAGFPKSWLTNYGPRLPTVEVSTGSLWCPLVQGLYAPKLKRKGVAAIALAHGPGLFPDYAGRVTVDEAL